MPFFLFLFYLFFFSFFLSSFFPLLFVVLRVPLPLPCSFFVRFVRSSCRFPFLPCVAFFAFIFASLLSLVTDSVIMFRLGATPPPALLASLKYAYSPCVLSYCVDVDFFLLLLFLPLFDFDLDIVCFILSFSCGYYAASSVLVSAATRLAYDI